MSAKSRIPYKRTLNPHSINRGDRGGDTARSVIEKVEMRYQLVKMTAGLETSI